MTSRSSPAWSVEVFFDGDCPLCRKEISGLRKLDRRSQIRFTDISLSTFDPARFGLDHGTLMARIHARLPDGSVIEGVEVFRRLYEAVGFGRIVALTRLAPVSWLLDRAYSRFAANRLRLTGRCDDHCAPNGGAHQQDGATPLREAAS